MGRPSQFREECRCRSHSPLVRACDGKDCDGCHPSSGLIRGGQREELARAVAIQPRHCLRTCLLRICFIESFRFIREQGASFLRGPDAIEKGAIANQRRRFHTLPLPHHRMKLYIYSISSHDLHKLRPTRVHMKTRGKRSSGTIGSDFRNHRHFASLARSRIRPIYACTFLIKLDSETKTSLLYLTTQKHKYQ